MLKRFLAILLCGLLFETVLAADAWAIQPAGPVLNGKAMKVKSVLDRVGTGAALWLQSACATNLL
jgi:hypothetical protein